MLLMAIGAALGLAAWGVDYGVVWRASLFGARLAAQSAPVSCRR